MNLTGNQELGAKDPFLGIGQEARQGRGEVLFPSLREQSQGRFCLAGEDAFGFDCSWLFAGAFGAVAFSPCLVAPAGSVGVCAGKAAAG
jgi:hypothetical protein